LAPQCSAARVAPHKETNLSLHFSSLNGVFGFLLFLYYLFFDFSKIYTSRFFFHFWSPNTSSTGGKSIPPDEPTVGAL